MMVGSVGVSKNMPEPLQPGGPSVVGPLAEGPSGQLETWGSGATSDVGQTSREDAKTTNQENAVVVEKGDAKEELGSRRDDDGRIASTNAEFGESDADSRKQGSEHTRDEFAGSSEKIARLVEKVAAPLAVGSMASSVKPSQFDVEEADLSAVVSGVVDSFEDIMDHIPNHDVDEFGVMDGWSDMPATDHGMCDIQYMQLAAAPSAMPGSQLERTAAGFSAEGAPPFSPPRSCGSEAPQSESELARRQREDDSSGSPGRKRTRTANHSHLDATKPSVVHDAALDSKQAQHFGDAGAIRSDQAAAVAPTKAENVPCLHVGSVVPGDSSIAGVNDGAVVGSHGFVSVPGIGMFPKQPAARLEAHPVLGRLHLPGTLTKRGKRVVGTSSSRAGRDEEEERKKENVPGADTAPREIAENSGGLQNPDAALSCSQNVLAVANLPSEGGRDDEHTTGQPRKDAVPSSDSVRPSSLAGPKASSIVGSDSGGSGGAKKRVVWTPELHERFVQAVSAVGLHQAVPKTLILLMNVEGLTSEHVKSHLQKYRKNLRKQSLITDRTRVTTHMVMAANAQHLSATLQPPSSHPEMSQDGDNRLQPRHELQQQQHQEHLDKNAMVRGERVPLLMPMSAAAPHQSNAVMDAAPHNAAAPLDQRAHGAGFEGHPPTVGIFPNTMSFVGPPSENAASFGALGGVSSTSNRTHAVIPIQPAIASQSTASGGSTRNEVKIGQGGFHVSPTLGASNPPPIAPLPENPIGGGVVPPPVPQSFVPHLPSFRVGAVSSNAQRSISKDVKEIQPSRGSATTRDAEAKGEEGNNTPGSVTDSVHRQIERQLEMQERTMQLQLEMQMMVHRTVSLQRKLRFALERQSFVLNRQSAGGEGGESEPDFVQEHSRLLREQRAMQAELERQQTLLKQQMDEQEHVRQQLLKQSAHLGDTERPRQQCDPSVLAGAKADSKPTPPPAD